MHVQKELIDARSPLRTKDEEQGRVAIAVVIIILIAMACAGIYIVSLDPETGPLPAMVQSLNGE